MKPVLLFASVCLFILSSCISNIALETAHTNGKDNKRSSLNYSYLPDPFGSHLQDSTSNFLGTSNLILTASKGVTDNFNLGIIVSYLSIGLTSKFMFKHKKGSPFVFAAGIQTITNIENDIVLFLPLYGSYNFTENLCSTVSPRLIKQLEQHPNLLYGVNCNLSYKFWESEVFIELGYLHQFGSNDFNQLQINFGCDYRW